MHNTSARVRTVLVTVIGSGFPYYASVRLCADLGLDSMDIAELEVELGIEFGGTFKLNAAIGKIDMTCGELVELVDAGPSE